MSQADSSADRGPSPEELRRVVQGDAEAVDVWFRSEHPEVYRLCFGFLADAAEAEDVAQDAMIHLLDHLARWDAARPYRPWRDRVVLNRCRDRLRRNEARGRALRRAAVEEPPGPVHEASHELERREVQDVLREALTGLSPREREVFVLRDLEGTSTRETAGLLEVGESTVRSLLTLARRRLRGLLEARVPGLAADLAGEGGSRGRG